MAERVLMLIDGHSLVFRGFYALQELGRHPAVDAADFDRLALR